MKKSVSALLAIFLIPSAAFCAATGDASIPTKAVPTTNDKVTIGDAADVNSTTGKLKSKDITLGNLPISTATQTALNGKANASAFASQSAFTSAWGWTPGGISAWSDIQALLTGTGTYVRADGTTGDPTGTLPPGTEGQTILYGSGGTPGAVNLAPLAFTDNVSRNTTTGVVSVPVTATATSGSAVPFTSGGAYTQLAGKQDADPDLNTAAGASGAGNSKYFGTNSGGTAGFYDLPISAGGIPHVSSGDPSTAGAWNYNTIDHKLRTRQSNGDVYASAALTIETAADTTPDAFTFTDETDIALSTDKTSNAITVTGINWPAEISVTGDTGYGYAKNGAACTNAPGFVSLNDTVSACVTSSASNGTATTSTVTIGEVSDTYSATTMAGSSCTSGTLTGGIDWITGKTNNSGGALSAGNPKGQSFTLGETVGIYSFSISISSEGGANPITCRYGTEANLSSYIGVGTTTMATGTREIVFDTHTPIPAGTTIYAACVMDADSPVAYYDRALEDNTTGVAISGSGSWSTVSAGTSDMKFQVKVCQ